MGSSGEAVALIVPVECAQKIRSELEQLNLWDATKKLKKLTDSAHVAVPINLNDRNISIITARWPDYKIAKIHLPISKKIKVQQTSSTVLLQREIQSLLKQYGLSEKLLDEVPSKWEKHGDLVIVPAQAFSSSEWSLIGSDLWHVVAKCLACGRLARHSAIANDGFRSSNVEMLLGENGEVIHTDNGIKYYYDVTKCMFSAGNITEKMRVANLDCTNETIVDLYAGIGYFTLPYLIHTKAHHLHACEWNPDAVQALRHNLHINGISDRCTVHEGDNRLLQLSPVADRINLGLIPSSEEGWPVAVRVLKQSGGILHIHGNVTTIPQRSLAIDSVDRGCCVSQISENGIGPHHNFCQEGKLISMKQQSSNSLGKESTDCLFRDNSDETPHMKPIKDYPLPYSDLFNDLEHESLALQDVEIKNISKITPADTTEGGFDDISQESDSSLQQSSSEYARIKSQQQTYCDNKTVQSDHIKYSSLDFGGRTSDMNSLSNNLSSKSDVLESFGGQELSQKKEGKGEIRLACQEWSFYVQRKIRSLLEEQKGGVWAVTQLHVEVVKSYAPHIVHAVLDLQCRPVG